MAANKAKPKPRPNRAASKAKPKVKTKIAAKPGTKATGAKAKTKAPPKPKSKPTAKKAKATPKPKPVMTKRARVAAAPPPEPIAPLAVEETAAETAALETKKGPLARLAGGVGNLIARMTGKKAAEPEPELDPTLARSPDQTIELASGDILAVADEPPPIPKPKS